MTQHYYDDQIVSIKVDELVLIRLIEDIVNLDFSMLPTIFDVIIAIASILFMHEA